MTAIDRTAYPRFKESYSAPELHTLLALWELRGLTSP